MHRDHSPPPKTLAIVVAALVAFLVANVGFATPVILSTGLANTSTWTPSLASADQPAKIAGWNDIASETAVVTANSTTALTMSSAHYKIALDGPAMYALPENGGRPGRPATAPIAAINDGADRINSTVRSATRDTLMVWRV
ncbi:MAG: hypothetical protein LiPW15_584 [Parcubacteria group bacterium LiPW_15]|nr:MAG: hypothetical protein LiPW15_584 [Parcubacteria group bacterium LiPW_15]